MERAVDVNRQRRARQGIDRRLAAALAQLRPRQRELLQLLAEGADTQSLAEELGVSVRTIEMDRARIMQKLGLKSLNALLHFALLVHPGRDYARLKARQAPGGVASRDAQGISPQSQGSGPYVSLD